MQPLLKWAGGKRRISTKILEIVNYQGNGTYHEPFLGGGAVFLEYTPTNAVCIDYNDELINFYTVVKDHHLELIELLRNNYVEGNNRDFYYETRALDRDEDIFLNLTNIEKAARFMYLNKTCYNGLWRVNRKGQNNVPFGRYVNPKILDEELIIEANEYFNEGRKTFINGDFALVLDYAVEGDFVYFDPPYDVERNESEFVSYTATGFDRDDQVRLKEVCDILVDRGVTVAVSNSNTEFMRNLYTNGHNYQFYELNDDIRIRRLIGSNIENRRVVSELLIIGRRQ